MNRITEQTDRKTHNQATGFMLISSCTLNALTREEIAPAALATFTALLSFTERRRGQRIGHPFRRTIAARTGQSVRTVTSHLQQLRDAGLITIEQDPFGGPNRYAVIDPCGSCFNGSKEVNETARSRGSKLPDPLQPDVKQGSKASSPKPLPKRVSFAQSQEMVTEPASTNKLDPDKCAHIPIDDTGYCTACGTSPGIEPPVEPDSAIAEWRQIQDVPLPL